MTDSTIKGVIDAWYKTNIEGTPAESLLEDTVWCNDRSVTDKTYTLSHSTATYFSPRTRYETTLGVPSLLCNQQIDSFTVEVENGNGDLDYPIGLITMDESLLAGKSTINYLSFGQSASGEFFWSMSPGTFVGGVCKHMVIRTNTLGIIFSVTHSYGVRPSISLKNSATISGGNGSYATPYLIG